MKLLLFTALFLLSNCIFAQKTDCVWLIGNARIDFNYTPPSVSFGMNVATSYNSNPICDKDGNLLLFISSKALYDHNLVELKYISGSVMHSPSLVPYPYDEDKTILFYSEFVDRKHTLKKLVITHSENNRLSQPEIIEANYSAFTFVQQEGTENVWFVASRNKEQTDVSLITKDGILPPRTFDFYINLGNAVVSNDNTMIVSGFNTKYKDLVFFDNKNGEFSTERYKLLGDSFVFSENGKYIYGVYQSRCFRCEIGKIKQGYSIEECSEFVVVEGVSSKMKLGPDGNIYFLDGFRLAVLEEPEADEPVFSKTIALYNNITYSYLPFTFHYFRNPTSPDPCAGMQKPSVKWR